MATLRKISSNHAATKRKRGDSVNKILRLYSFRLTHHTYNYLFFFFFVCLTLTVVFFLDFFASSSSAACTTRWRPIAPTCGSTGCSSAAHVIRWRCSPPISARSSQSWPTATTASRRHRRRCSARSPACAPSTATCVASRSSTMIRPPSCGHRARADGCRRCSAATRSTAARAARGVPVRRRCVTARCWRRCTPAAAGVGGDHAGAVRARSRGRDAARPR